MDYRGLPLYQALIKKDYDGIFAISLVECPAVESDFLCFSQNEKRMMFEVNDSDEHLITGVVMLANTPIYRRDGDYEYFITYSRETIKQMCSKMLADGTFKNIDVQHDGKMIEGLELVELFIKDEEKGISPAGFEDISNGSMFATFHVYDDDLWKEIKEGDALNGFSLEGNFSVVRMSKINKDKKNKNMSKFSKFIKSLMNFGSAETDKGNIYFDGEEITEGIEIYVDGEGDEKVLAEDGEYSYEDKVIVVVDGKVSEIRVKAEEPEESVEVEAKKAQFNAIKVAFEATYEEKIEKIAAAIREKGFDAWVVEAADSYAVAEIWNDENGSWKDYRFDVSWDEDGNCTVSDPVEVKSEFVPVEEGSKEDIVEVEVEAEEETPAEEVEVDIKEDRIKALEDAVEEIRQSLDELRKQVVEIAEEPAAEPIVEEFARVSSLTPSKGNKAAELLKHFRD